MVIITNKRRQQAAWRRRLNRFHRTSALGQSEPHGSGNKCHEKRLVQIKCEHNQKGNDIKERKMTLPFIHALNKCSKPERSKIIRMMRKKNKSAQMVDEIMDFVRSYGGIEYAENIMFDYKNKALDILSQLPQNEANNSLTALLEYTVSRTK
jgi:hypothetical protein